MNVHAVKEYFAEKNPTSQKEEQVVPVEEESRTDDSDVPVYYESFGYAAENGEVDLYRISRQLNEECRNAIEEAIADNFDGMNLADDATKSVVEQFGMERMGYILAYTLNYNNHDGRYSHSNKEWADTTCKGERGSNIRTDWIVRSHPAVLNGFVDMYRKELAAEQQREPEKPFVQQFYVVTDLQTNPMKIKSIGFSLEDGSIYSGMFDLMVGGEVQAEVVNHIQHYRESPLVQKAISDMKTLLEKRQASKQGVGRTPQHPAVCS